MPKMKNLLGLLLLAGIIAFAPSGGEAAESGKKPEAKAPVVIVADEIYFSDLTGNMFAKGNVVVDQDKTKLQGDLVRGNTKQNEVWIDDKGIFNEPGTRLVGTGIHYDYKARTGTMVKASGKSGSDFIAGRNIEMLPDVMVFTDGTVTSCPAEVPHYHVSASKVEIWPGDKLIAHNAKFWIGNKVIFSMAKYQRSLRPDAPSNFPEVGYYSEDGAYLKQHMEYPLTNNIAVFGDFAYYSKTGYRPVYGAVLRESTYEVKALRGYFRDGDGHWVKKDPEVTLQLFARPLGPLPINYSIGYSHGKWSDNTKSSWHNNYGVYFSGFPIKLGGGNTLSLGTGINFVRESYNDDKYTLYTYDATLTSKWSPRLESTLEYHYRRNNRPIFAYGDDDLSREADLRLTYKMDELNTIGFYQRYDIGNNRIYDQDITLKHLFHCWEAEVTYRAKRSQVVVSLSTVKF